MNKTCLCVIRSWRDGRMVENAKSKFTNSNSDSLLLINSLVGFLDQEAKEASLMRCDRRYDLNTKVVIGFKEGQDQFVVDSEAWGSDISNNGVGLLTTKSFTIGKMIYITMSPVQIDKVFALVTVRRCKKSPWTCIGWERRLFSKRRKFRHSGPSKTP